MSARPCKRGNGSLVVSERNRQHVDHDPAQTASAYTLRRLQGHLRLILLPIVYNAMAGKENLRALPLFIALQQAMRASTYNKLLRHPSSDPITSEAREQRPRSASTCLV